MIPVSLNNISFLSYTLALNGGQLNKLFRAIGKFLKELFKHTDDVARIASKNRGFFASIPGWLWVVIGIIVVAGIIYYIGEEC